MQGRFLGKCMSMGGIEHFELILIQNLRKSCVTNFACLTQELDSGPNQVQISKPIHLEFAQGP